MIIHLFQKKQTEIECKRGLIALVHGLLCEISERSLSFAEFSDRAPLTKLYPSLKNLPPHVRESKTVLDSGFHAVDFGFQVLDSWLCHWNLDSGFRRLVGFRIPMVIVGFRISRAKISRIPQSGFPYMGWNLLQWPCIHCSRPKALSWRRSVGLLLTMSSQNLIFKLLILIDRADRLTGMLCYENISDYGNRQRLA